MFQLKIPKRAIRIKFLLLQISHMTVLLSSALFIYKMDNRQGRAQDFSHGRGGRDFLSTTNFENWSENITRETRKILRVARSIAREANCA